ncbi:class I SAM-dependent methyltransferase [Streptomyces clavifer]|uniref:class I SAM-dependent methyltransferase n=1 Tax=Streptomyces TaxID=1883 RepID=UPI000701CB39|nr:MULTISPECIES: class I SAM-dependent methyltransferase [unclassified Streptomyces]KQX80583.1 methyltransferase type 12 [Streptomyces sp. Root1319]KQZ19702.1 methyltransferase type 12 [Streptomyces sp. Root55]MDX3065083.1 class I SAM-dependent methyltransferase [Streptomyces sp. ND04-05B]
MTAHHDTHGHIGHERGSDSDVAFAQLLELDAEVLASYLAELTGLLADLIDPTPARVLDLGSGPGTGSFALARRFPTAQVTAVDLSAQMLHRLREQAAVHGVTDRISTLEANIDEPWDAIGANGPYDLIWAASFLHHVADPARTLAQTFEQLRPGGLLAVTEMDFFPLYLPEDAGVGRPGLEARLHAAMNTQPDHEWTDQLENAGFTVEKRPFEIRLDHAQAGPSVNAYALGFLAKLRSHATDLLNADDLAALDILLDKAQPNSVAHRDDLRVHTTRTTWIAHRP